MSQPKKAVRSDFTRVWSIENGALPGRAPLYMGTAMINASTYAFGAITRVEIPSDRQYGGFEEVMDVPGPITRPATSIKGRYPTDVSDMLRLGRKGCALDFQLHVGACEDPRDFNHGWQKVRFYEKARVTQYADENMGAMQSADRNVANETIDITSRDMYEMGRKTFSQRAQSLTNLEIVAIDICDGPGCGDCGTNTSDGSQKVIALRTSVVASPSVSPQALYTSDGGVTWAMTPITVESGAYQVVDGECVGSWYVAITNLDNALDYVDSAALFDGTGVFVRTSVGFVAGKGPRAIVSVGPASTWIVGDGGYVYFTADPAAGVTVQDAGAATTQNLSDVDAFDSLHVVAVGASNAVIFTENGGVTWNTVTGPSVGVVLNAVEMISEFAWLVGNASGAVYYTVDSGAHWTAVSLPIVATAIKDIKSLTASVLVMAITIAGPFGRILQSIDGGNSWYVMPEGSLTIPTNTQIDQLGVAFGNPNVFYASGQTSAVGPGIILKAA